MTDDSRSPGLLSVLAFALVLTASSLDVANKYLGVSGMVGYAVLVVAVVLGGNRFGVSWFTDHVSERTSLLLAGLTFIFLGVIAFAVYPVANSGAFGGGSDADDALILAATELLSGRYPFYPATYLGNQIAPMPGAVFLASPFILLNIFPLQNVFWLLIFFIVLRREIKSGSRALGLFLTVLILSPAVLHNVVTGTDRTANAIYILTALWIMMRTIPVPSAPVWTKLLGSVFLGIGLSSRSNFVFVAPLIFSMLIQTAGWREAVKYCAISALTAIAITLPFWLYDPTGFSPFYNQSAKISGFSSILSYATVVIPASGLLLAFALSFRRMSLDGSALLWSGALTQIYSVFLLSALSSISSGRLDLYFGHVSYGVFFLFFAVMAFANDATRRPPRRIAF